MTFGCGSIFDVCTSCVKLNTRVFLSRMIFFLELCGVKGVISPIRMYSILSIGRNQSTTSDLEWVAPPLNCLHCLKGLSRKNLAMFFLSLILLTWDKVRPRFWSLKFRRDFEAEDWSVFWHFWLVEVLKLNFGQDPEARFGQYFLIEMLMFGWDFEVDAWSRFWRWNLIKICVRACDVT